MLFPVAQVGKIEVVRLSRSDRRRPPNEHLPAGHIYPRCTAAPGAGDFEHILPSPVIPYRYARRPSRPQPHSDAVYGQPANLDLPRSRFPIDDRFMWSWHRTRRPGYSHHTVSKVRCRHKSHVPDVDIADMFAASGKPFDGCPERATTAPACRLVEHRAARNIIVVRVSAIPCRLRPGKPRQAVLPPVLRRSAFRPPTGAIQKKFVSSLSAILLGNHILDTPGLTARIFVPLCALGFRLQIPAPGFTPGFHPAAVVPPPGPRPNSVTPEANFGLAARIFSSPAAAPALMHRPRCARARSSPERFPRSSASQPGNT